MLREKGQERNKRWMWTKGQPVQARQLRQSRKRILRISMLYIRMCSGGLGTQRWQRTSHMTYSWRRWTGRKSFIIIRNRKAGLWSLPGTSWRNWERRWRTIHWSHWRKCRMWEQKSSTMRRSSLSWPCIKWSRKKSGNWSRISICAGSPSGNWRGNMG